jgi:hypothetical protein
MKSNNVIFLENHSTIIVIERYPFVKKDEIIIYFLSVKSNQLVLQNLINNIFSKFLRFCDVRSFTLRSLNLNHCWQKFKHQNFWPLIFWHVIVYDRFWKKIRLWYVRALIELDELIRKLSSPWKRKRNNRRPNEWRTRFYGNQPGGFPNDISFITHHHKS